MRNHRGLLGLFAVLLVAVSACDADPEGNLDEKKEQQEKDQVKKESATDNAGEVAIPPKLKPRAEADPMPAFHEIPAGPERKEAFFSYLAPVVRDINREVEKRREALMALENQLEEEESLDQEAADWLSRMVERYRVKAQEPEQQVAALKQRIDIIPVPLALAQGALESAWGTSRFARQGNNLFGKWCFTEGCGIVPAQRRADAIHEVASYDDVADATRDYIHHLNSHPVYEPLRDRRAQAREEGRLPRGTDLAAGLEKYSAKGEGYIRLVRQVINGNDLADRDGNKDDA